MTKLSVLIVEDSEDDAVLLLRELSKGGYDVDHQRVEDEEGMTAALERQNWDLVITDHRMPRFSSEAAIRLTKEKNLNIPVIIVSGSIGEEVAVGAMRAGAHDYLMKGNIKRLLPAIERELREAELRKDHHEAQQRIHYMAHHDALTGVINRYGFENRLVKLHATSNNRSSHAVLYIDLDQFKVVNDTCGHTAGDELLRQLIDVIKPMVRDNDTLARLGGDEFGVLLGNCALDSASRIAGDLIEAINSFKFHWKGKVLGVGASIGLVVLDEHFDSMAEIMSAADDACYVAKDNGRNQFFVYRHDDESLKARRHEMHWASRLRHAIDNNLFTLYYQDIKPVKGQAPGATMFEVLLRMQGEDGELVMPGAFIPAAERYYMINQVDRWVISEVFRCFSEHPDTYSDSTAFINLSGASIGDDELPGFIQKELSRYGVSPERFCFEVTETAAISNLGKAVTFLEELRNIGFMVALDDFGVGMSSFTYLKELPVDFIKIDGSFILGVQDDPMSKAIIEAINNIAHVVDLKTIGEHVETQEICDELSAMGIDFAQGYGIHRPSKLRSE